jgi:hypothetical protein
MVLVDKGQIRFVRRSIRQDISDRLRRGRRDRIACRVECRIVPRITLHSSASGFVKRTGTGASRYRARFHPTIRADRDAHGHRTLLFLTKSAGRIVVLNPTGPVTLIARRGAARLRWRCRWRRCRRARRCYRRRRGNSHLNRRGRRYGNRRPDVRGPCRYIHRRRRSHGRRRGRGLGLWLGGRRFFLRLRGRRLFNIDRRHPLDHLGRRLIGETGDQRVTESNMNQSNDDNRDYAIATHLLVSISHSVASLHRTRRNAPAIKAPCHDQRRKVPKKYPSASHRYSQGPKAQKVSEMTHREPAKAILYHALRSGRVFTHHADAPQTLYRLTPDSVHLGLEQAERTAILISPGGPVSPSLLEISR